MYIYQTQHHEVFYSDAFNALGIYACPSIALNLCMYTQSFENTARFIQRAYPAPTPPLTPSPLNPRPKILPPTSTPSTPTINPPRSPLISRNVHIHKWSQRRIDKLTSHSPILQLELSPTSVVTLSIIESVAIDHFLGDIAAVAI